MQPAAAENPLNTSNHFRALEMANFIPYKPTAPHFKSVATRRKPASKQPGILDKLQRTKPALDRHGQPAPAAADENDGGYRSGIQGMF
jgi:hypothetical protein